MLVGSFSIDGTTNDDDVSLTIENNSVDLGTHTTGNYVQSVTAGDGIATIPAASEGAALTVAVDGVLLQLDSLAPLAD